MKTEARVRLPDHDFVVAVRHKLNPSVISLDDSTPNRFADQAEGRLMDVRHVLDMLIQGLENRKNQNLPYMMQNGDRNMYDTVNIHW